MKSVITFGMAVVLASTLAAPGFAAGSSEQAREANTRNPSQTTTPWSSTMSSANTPSHDSNSLSETQTQPGKQTDQQNKDNNSAATSSCGTAC
jgi:hypothetical protein